MRLCRVAVALGLLLAMGRAAAAETVEILHRWTTPGEVAAVNVLKAELARQGIAWTDMALPGQLPDATSAVLKKRVTTNDPPTAAVMFRVEVQEWARLGALADLNAVAAAEGWDKVIPKALQPASKYQGKWVAVPFNISLLNWLWASRPALESAGVAEMPSSWDGFIAALEKLKKRGLIPFAMSGRPFEINVVFESVVIATGGPDFHRKVFDERDREALGSETMKKAFDRMTQLRHYVDDGYARRGWPESTALLIQGKAGFEIMGDWVKGDFVAAGKVAGRDFACARVPATQGSLLYVSDQFAMFNLGSGGFRRAAAQQTQAKLASIMLSPKVQSDFNVVKGSIPVRLDVSDAAFDDCGKLGIKDLREAEKTGAMVLAMSLSAPPLVKKTFYEIIAQQFAGELSSAEAARRMAAAVD